MTPIPLQELPLRPSTLSLLQQRGFQTTNELDDCGGLSNFAAELDVPLPKAHNVMEEVLGCISHPLPEILTATDLYAYHKSNNSNIVTFSQSIDKLLGGGIDIGQVTEIAGLPGVGKTQLAMQLCVNTRLPKSFGGVEGQAVYIDAEGSLSPERLFDMAKSLVGHVQSTARRKQSAFPSDFTPEQILDSIHIYRVHDEAAQTASLYSLPHFLEQQMEHNLPVKLIVIDSIAFHYRSITPTNQNYYMQRTKNLTKLAAFLGDLATNYKLAVVAINQMTTKVEDGSSRYVPALGESWAHATTSRLLLSCNNSEERTCTLVKSPHRPPGSAKYQVLGTGIRDLRKLKHTEAEQEQEVDRNKRLRTN